ITITDSIVGTSDNYIFAFNTFPANIRPAHFTFATISSGFVNGGGSIFFAPLPISINTDGQANIRGPDNGTWGNSSAKKIKYGCSFTYSLL
ncbi:MAG TPA: hypothetical protein VFM18_10170, partial [Methanosarcina sp.]|nr:hypothetical protein [Methanosarcina sp.]